MSKSKNLMMEWYPEERAAWRPPEESTNGVTENRNTQLPKKPKKAAEKKDSS